MDIITPQIYLADPYDKYNPIYIAIGKQILRGMYLIFKGQFMSKVAVFENKDGVLIKILVQHLPIGTGIDKIITIRESVHGLFLVFIRDTSKEKDGYEYELVYDDSPEKKGRDYRVLCYEFDWNISSLTDNGLMPKGYMRISDEGLTLNAQSGSNVYAASLPSIFSYNDTIDYAEFEETAWGTVLLLYQEQSRIVGSFYVSGWSKTDNGHGFTYTENQDTFSRIPGNRHQYVNANGSIRACMFKNQQTLKGAGVMYRELNIIMEDNFYQLWKNEIAYKATPADNSYITGAFIGIDYILGIPRQVGYKWKTYHSIDIFDEKNALVKTESNEMTRGGTNSIPYTIDLTVVARFYGDPRPGFAHKTDVYRYVGVTDVQDDICVRVEELKVGESVIDTAKCEYGEYNSNAFDWLPGAFPPMPLISTSMSYSGLPDGYGGIYGDGAESASGGIKSALLKFNCLLKTENYTNPTTGRMNARIFPVHIGKRHVAYTIGERNIHVTAFDNYDGAENYIIMYRKDTFYVLNSYDVSNVNDGTTPTENVVKVDTPVVQKHYIMYKISGGGSEKLVITGDCRGHSCQIHNGFMAYTYFMYNTNSFIHRIVGIINMLSGRRKEFTMDDKDTTAKRFDAFDHVHHAAIGIM